MSDKNVSDRPDKNGAVTQAVRDYKEFARAKRRAGNLQTAGEYYVAAARGNLMQYRRLPDDLTDSDDPPSPNAMKFGFAIKGLLLGALCFRIDGAYDRCHHHCKQGESIVTDLLIEPAFTMDARVGLCHEICGDFRLIGDLGEYDEAYTMAANRYTRVDNDLGWSSESEFEDVIQIPLELADSVEMGLDTEHRNRIMYTSLDDRIEYKKGTTLTSSMPS
ncbi:hypothetical protein [Natrinema sp. H-ect4]|uniref:hypothetical protein n=1 Tax=Natrinema sp. H-ect4 TaxID=3242699 RepID=UPI0035A89230